ncbi:hypothetical protein [Anaeromicropila herbilytica]|nr:hypothetical protein [Anaeromicropila herbilytica]
MKERLIKKIIFMVLFFVIYMTVGIFLDAAYDWYVGYQLLIHATITSITWFLIMLLFDLIEYVINIFRKEKRNNNNS